jgi:hypothetical protein
LRMWGTFAFKGLPSSITYPPPHVPLILQSEMWFPRKWVHKRGRKEHAPNAGQSWWSQMVRYKIKHHVSTIFLSSSASQQTSAQMMDI